MMTYVVKLLKESQIFRGTLEQKAFMSSEGCRSMAHLRYANEGSSRGPTILLSRTLAPQRIVWSLLTSSDQY
jgi:hypothetical protein